MPWAEPGVAWERNLIGLSACNVLGRLQQVAQPFAHRLVAANDDETGLARHLESSEEFGLECLRFVRHARPTGPAELVPGRNGACALRADVIASLLHALVPLLAQPRQAPILPGVVGHRITPSQSVLCSAIPEAKPTLLVSALRLPSRGCSYWQEPCWNGHPGPSTPPSFALPSSRCGPHFQSLERLPVGVKGFPMGSSLLCVRPISAGKVPEGLCARARSSTPASSGSQRRPMRWRLRWSSSLRAPRSLRGRAIDSGCGTTLRASQQPRVASSRGSRRAFGNRRRCKRWRAPFRCSAGSTPSMIRHLNTDVVYATLLAEGLRRSFSHALLLEVCDKLQGCRRVARIRHDRVPSIVSGSALAPSLVRRPRVSTWNAKIARVDQPEPGLLSLSVRADGQNEVLVLVTLPGALMLGLVDDRPRGASASPALTQLRRHLEGARIESVATSRRAARLSRDSSG